MDKVSSGERRVIVVTANWRPPTAGLIESEIRDQLGEGWKALPSPTTSMIVGSDGQLVFVTTLLVEKVPLTQESFLIPGAKPVPSVETSGIPSILSTIGKTPGILIASDPPIVPRCSACNNELSWTDGSSYECPYCSGKLPGTGITICQDPPRMPECPVCRCEMTGAGPNSYECIHCALGNKLASPQEEQAKSSGTESSKLVFKADPSPGWPTCRSCGHTLMRMGAIWKCPNCGESFDRG